MSKAMQLKARIRNIASKNGVPAQAVLQNYMLERLLERVSKSAYSDKFILKGGLLIASLVGIGSRTTMDMDATLRGYPLSEEALRQAWSDICAIQLEDDVILTLRSIKPIRHDDEYGGYRVSVLAQYEIIKTPLKIDITSGDVITPQAIRYPFPMLFDDRVIDIWAYNIETTLAEKLETILSKSTLNTRPRDFYDVYFIMKTQKNTVDPQILMQALVSTCQKRSSSAVLDDRERILLTIKRDTIMRQRWDRYCQAYTFARGIEFDDVFEMIREVLSF